MNKRKIKEILITTLAILCWIFCIGAIAWTIISDIIIRINLMKG